MLIPLSWIKEYVDIKLPFRELAVLMSEAGLTIEVWKEQDGDIIFDPEVTPNRPDWLSVSGVAREIAAVTKTSIRYPVSRIRYKTTEKLKDLSIKARFDLCPKYTAAIIKNVKVKSSPDWLQKRIKAIGLRPINSLVDITNLVMWETGNPLHVFDIDKIRGKQMVMDTAKGNESFRSLDGLDYKLPKGAVIIKDVGRVIDLCGVKGGENTAVDNNTKNALIHVPIYVPSQMRRTSQALSLRSDASILYTKGTNLENTVPTLMRALELALELAGGVFNGEVLDISERPFKPWTVSLTHEKLENVLGIKIEKGEVLDIFKRLGLEISENKGVYSVEVSGRRADLQIAEDLIEEVVRLHGYNNFPKTLPSGPVPTNVAAYSWDFDFAEKVKGILAGAGFNEIYSYSLVSAKNLEKMGISPNAKNAFKLINPISEDFQYLRPNLLGGLIEGLKYNLPHSVDIRLFELGKVYWGKDLTSVSEPYMLTGIVNGEKFGLAKGAVELLLTKLHVEYEISPMDDNPSKWFHPGRRAVVKNKKGEMLGLVAELDPQFLFKFGLKGHVAIFDLDFAALRNSVDQPKYKPIPQNPPIIEDFSFTVPDGFYVGQLIKGLSALDSMIQKVELIDSRESNRTFRIHFNHPTKTLTDEEIKPLRQKIVKFTKDEFEAELRVN